MPNKFKEVLEDDRIYPSGWRHREFKGNYRPPLTPEQRAERDARRASRRDNDSRLESLLRQLAGSSHQPR